MGREPRGGAWLCGGSGRGAGPHACPPRSCRAAAVSVGAGYRGPILRSEALLGLLCVRLVALPYDERPPRVAGDPGLRIRLRQAGHILGSASVECDLRRGGRRTRVVLSRHLGAPHCPLRPGPTIGGCGAGARRVGWQTHLAVSRAGTVSWVVGMVAIRRRAHRGHSV
jgi:hypothetical protein